MGSGRFQRRSTAIFSGCTLCVAPAWADTGADMRAEIAALKQRIESLERRLEEADRARVPPPPVERDDAVANAAGPGPATAPATGASPSPEPPPIPGWWRVPGTPTSLRVWGHIRLGAYKDLDDNLNSYKFQAGNIHPNGDPARRQEGNIQAQLRLSRISFDSMTPTAYGTLRTVFAVDFGGAEPKTYQAEALQNNGFHLRLVHAYGTLGRFQWMGLDSEVLVGQTWSNFVDDPDTAESMDPSGPAGVPSERQPQVRYTARFGAAALSFAAENPIGDYQLPGTTSASSVNNTSTTNRWPDLTAKVEWEKPWGRAQLSGLYRQFHATDGLGHAASTVGTALIAGGTFHLTPRDRVGGQAWWGNGLGKYLPDEFGNTNAFAVDGYGTDGMRAEAQRMEGGSVWVRHHWSATWRSNVALGINRQHLAPFIVAATDQAERLRTAHVNLIYSPLPAVDFGVEIEFGEKRFRPALRLGDAHARRINFSSRIKFN